MFSAQFRLSLLSPPLLCLWIFCILNVIMEMTRFLVESFAVAAKICSTVELELSREATNWRRLCLRLVESSHNKVSSAWMQYFIRTIQIVAADSISLLLSLFTSPASRFLDNLLWMESTTRRATSATTTNHRKIDVVRPWGELSVMFAQKNLFLFENTFTVLIWFPSFSGAAASSLKLRLLPVARWSSV